LCHITHETWAFVPYKATTNYERRRRRRQIWPDTRKRRCEGVKGPLLLKAKGARVFKRSQDMLGKPGKETLPYSPLPIYIVNDLWFPMTWEISLSLSLYIYMGSMLLHVNHPIGSLSYRLIFITLAIYHCPSCLKLFTVA
jgi:hypothetical protein